MTQTQIQRALIAVSDKAGIAEFASRLSARGIEILSTGGTGQALASAGVAVREVRSVTEFPEMLGGRVKTLHPRIHGGILGRRNIDTDRQEMEEHGIPAIDLVVVNLYPFEKTIAASAGAMNSSESFADCIEQIDIGGPAMVRAAAKNHDFVAVVVDPADYERVATEIEATGGVTAELRRNLAAKAFRRTAAYDAAISNWFGQQLDGEYPETITEQWQRVGKLRYGENPHQTAAWYSRKDSDSFSMPDAELLPCEKELSYNNLLDLSAAVDCARDLQGPAAVVVKHCLPCGAAERGDLHEAFEAALAGDPLSAFGGILALTEPLEVDLARRIATPDLFFEVIHAPEVSAAAEQAIRSGAKWGKKCRILKGGSVTGHRTHARDLRAIPGAVLVQDRDRFVTDPQEFTVVSERQPTDSEWSDLRFAWRVVPSCRSNAILLAKNRSVVGVGAGQPSRVDSVAIACRKAQERAQGSVLSSDAFFPFPDGVELAIEHGVTAVIQPGGSMRDKKVIAAANRAGIAMVLTGERHFRH